MTGDAPFWLLNADERRLAVWALQCLLLTTVDAAHTRADLRAANALLLRLDRGAANALVVRHDRPEETTHGADADQSARPA